MVRAACVGLGNLGRMELALLDAMDGVTVVAGADPSPAVRQRTASEHDVATYANHDALLTAEAPDLVSIASPHTLHYEQARAALDAGVHVHLEKPMVTRLADARDLIDRATAAGLTLAVGYQRHFDPRFRELRRLIDEGRIGEPHMAACHLEQLWIGANHDGWRGDPALSGGGQLSDSGSHLLDALLWTTRSTPTAVSAEIDRRGYDVDVNAALSVRLVRRGGERPDDTPAPDASRLTASVGVTGAGRTAPDTGEAIHVWGTAGAVSFDGRRIRVTEAGGEPGASYESEPADPGFEALTRRKLANLVAAIRDEAELEITATDALKVTALTEAAYESAERGRRVEIDV
jgi:predicted dehydrogenase